MSVEVIDLLSSPLGPSPSLPAVINNKQPSKHAATPPRRTTGPSRALDYDVLDLTVESPKRPASKHAATTSELAVAGTKRTSSGCHRQDNDFLFLSDDSDGVGHLDGSLVAKKPRVSPSSPRGKKNGDSSFRRTASAAVGPKDRGHLQSVGMKRWNSVADPIEYSSSPHNASTSASHRDRRDENWKDSTANSRKQTKGKAIDTSRLPEPSSDPFASSPTRSPKVPHGGKHGSLGKSSARSDFLPPEQSASSKPPKRSNFVDLSSDPFDAPSEKAKGKAVKKPVAWDPISSSMPETGGGGHPLPSSPPAPRAGDRDPIDLDDLSGSDSEEFPEIEAIDFSKIKRTKRSYSISPPRKSKSKSKSKSTSTSKSTNKTAEEKEADKKKRAQQREVEQERKRVQKEQEKTQKALDAVKKKALEEVNKVRTDKKVSTPEMIVDIPSSLNPGLAVQIQELLKDMDVQHGVWNSRGVDNVVKWRRKVSCRFNEELGHWEPVPMHVKPENHVMVIVEAAEFVKLALGAEGHDLEAHVLKMKTHHPDVTIIYLIEGLTIWLRKNRNVRNRQFQSAVRNAGGGSEESSSAAGDSAAAPSSSRRRNNTVPQDQIYIDEDSIEDALLTLQVLHGTLIHHTQSPLETAQWVSVFTQHISTIPYRRAREATTSDAGFCMEAGQVQTGDGPRDTYVRMMGEMARVTTPIALGIAAEYGTVTELVKGLEAKGPLALEDCRKCANRDGAFTDRAVGPAVSKRIFKVFTGTDPGCGDI